VVWARSGDRRTYVLSSIFHEVGAFIIEIRILSMAAKQGPCVLVCMPNRTKCILLVSLVLVRLVGDYLDCLGLVL
jgi:hypothetical protein